ncbi:DUF6307 family protein [Amycolatopsis anabasis]|uniref:DUF6307 family protein n=1 Tax=Amycolatopsis anabasis TaxID=1840409 RepID=UPI0015D272E7|nr:DUF6307 family protein [Amycolatopsis anabasis]
MTANIAYISRYEQRVKLVQDVLKARTKLSDSECHTLAVQVLHTLDRIPEKLR